MSLSAAGIDGEGNLRRGVSSAMAPLPMAPLPALCRSWGSALAPPRAACLPPPPPALLFPPCVPLVLSGSWEGQGLCCSSPAATQGMSCVGRQLRAGGFHVGVGWGACQVSVPTLSQQLLVDGGVEPRGTPNTPGAGASFLIGAKMLSPLVVWPDLPPPPPPPPRQPLSPSPQSPLGTCILWCSPETPGTDAVWKSSGAGRLADSPQWCRRGNCLTPPRLRMSSEFGWSLSLRCQRQQRGTHEWELPNFLSPWHRQPPPDEALAVPPSLRHRFRRGAKPCPRPGVPSDGPAHHHAASPRPGPWLVSQRDADVAHWRQNSRGAPGCASLPPLAPCKLFFCEKVNCPWWCLGWTQGRMLSPRWDERNSRPAQRPLPSPARPPAPRSPGEAVPEDGNWIYRWKTTWCAPSMVRRRSISCLKVIPSIFLQLLGLWAGGGVQRCRGRTPRGKFGSSSRSRDSGVGPAPRTQACGKVPRKFCSSIRKCWHVFLKQFQIWYLRQIEFVTSFIV